MATERQVGFSRVALRLMLAAGRALLAGCSDASRFSSDPFSIRSGIRRSRRAARAGRRPFKHGFDLQLAELLPVQSRRSRRPPTRRRRTPRLSRAQPGGVAWQLQSLERRRGHAHHGRGRETARFSPTAMACRRRSLEGQRLLKLFASAAGSRLVIPVYRATAAKRGRSPRHIP